MTAWSQEVLACPRCKGNLSKDLVCGQCGKVGRWEEGIACFAISKKDDSISWYEAKGGSHFRERMNVPFTMSSLDTFVYHQYLAELKPADPNAVIIDVGAGDGRNAEPWFRWGYKRVIAADAIYASLARFRDYLRREHPQWLEHILLVQCDARHLPLRNGIAGVVTAIEALYYLNDEYPHGLAECAHLLGRDGKILLSEPTREGAYLTSLLYGGIGDMLKMQDMPGCYEKSGDSVLQSRTFTEGQLTAELEKAGLMPQEIKGLSFLSTILGFLRGEGKLSTDDQPLFPDVCSLLADIGQTSAMRRTHVVVAKPSASH